MDLGFRKKIKIQLAKRMNTEEAAEAFLASMSGLRAEKTISWYRNLLIPFARHFPGRDIETLTLNELRGYRAHLVKKDTIYGGGSTHKAEKGHLSPWTIHAGVKAIRRLFAWLYEEGIISNNPALRLEIPPLPSETKQGISDDDAEKMVRASRMSPRDYAILVFIRDTGCRIGGLTSLKISNLNLKARHEKDRYRALVTEKGQKDRIIFMSKAAYNAIRTWLEVRPDWINHDYVFTTYGGKPLTEVGVYEIFRRLARQTGVDESWSPHEWRHRFARKLLSNGANLQHVSQILGHNSITVTSRFYGKLALGQIEDAYERYYAGVSEDNEATYNEPNTESTGDATTLE